jgi:acyl-CoA thioesterase
LAEVVSSVTQPEAPARNAAQEMFDADAASQRLGIEVLDIGPGRAVARMRITADMVNGHAIAHGGYIFLLADTAFACACNSHGPVTVAAGADITFVAPAKQGDVLTARAEERTRFGRSGIYDVTVLRGGSEGSDGSGEEVIAEFRGRSRTIARAPSSVLPGSSSG